MSEFRIFCIGGFVGAGIVAAAGNHGWAKLAPGSAWEQILTSAFIFGCIAVTIFGRRSA